MRRALALLLIALTVPTAAPASAEITHACRVARYTVRIDLEARTILRRQLRHATGARRASIIRRLGVVRRDLKRHRARRARACST